MSWGEGERVLQAELADLVKHKPPVSRSKVETITKLAYDHAAVRFFAIFSFYRGLEPEEIRLRSGCPFRIPAFALESFFRGEGRCFRFRSRFASVSVPAA